MGIIFLKVSLCMIIDKQQQRRWFCSQGLLSQQSKNCVNQLRNQKLKQIEGPMNIPITQTGKRIQNYVFNYSDFLGAGNFSKCYKGYNELTSEVVAIKIVELNSLKSKKLQQLLFQEIQILKKLNHPSVLKCYQIFTSNRNCYIITELCNQGNLENRLKGRKVFEEAEANPIIKDVYDGLVYLGQNNIVHRDLKSANIFLHNGRAKIADFGFAKEIRHNFKDLNIGSPLYMAPQGILHNIYGPKTQVWAIGILVYQLFHGASPYIHCKTQQQLKQRVMIPLNWKQLRTDLSQDIKEFILTCLQINQQTRATIEQLGNLGYMRRLAQGPMGYQGNGFELRSLSKSVHLAVNNEDGNNFEGEKQRVNNNFRAQTYNNPFSRDVSRSKNNQRQQVIFRSVDMRGMNSNNSRNHDNYHSPNKRSGFNNANHGPAKFQINSPGVKRPQMIGSLRPMSSQNQPIYINNNQAQQNIGSYHTQQQLQIPFNSNPNYQYRVYQQPQENLLVMPNQQINMIGKSNEVIYSDSINTKSQVQNRPLSSYNQQQQQQQIPHTFESIGYNLINGFFTNQLEPNQNLNSAPTQSQQLPFNSNHQRNNIGNFNQLPDTTQNQTQNYMFRSKINFKQAIFFIHHCRLVFKFLYLFKELPCFDESSYLKIFRYLMSVLTQLNKLAQSNGVVADGQKAGLKVKKFRQVNLQYLAKYQKQLQERNYTVHPQSVTQQSLTLINSTLRQVFFKINEEITMNGRKQFLSSGDENTIVLGHLCIIIIGIEAQNFKKLLQFKLIETILNTPKEEFTMASYKNYKDKFIK